MKRRRALAGLVAGVALVHLWLATALAPARLGEGAAQSPPRRIEVVVVRELAPAAPPRVAPAAARPRRSAVAVAAAAAPASAAPVSASLSEPAVTASAPPALAPPAEGTTERRAEAAIGEPMPPWASASAIEAPGPAAASMLAASSAPASAPAPAAFEWPPSTRLTYRLTGNYRGPVEGQARVEWLRSGARYQVHMELSVGPAFAPLVSRHITSEGEITEQGLRPRRYDEETRAVLREPRRQTIYFDAEHVRLPSGRELPRPEGVQDSASQFVQPTWLFTLQPQLLEPGHSIDLPLALPRQVELWTYDMLAAETLATPVGPVDAVHVKPRREARAGGDLTAEIWVAPALQYLPVRILIRQDAESYVDLLLEQLPQQAQAGR